MHLKQLESYPKKIKKYTDYKSAPWGLENLYEIVNNFHPISMTKKMEQKLYICYTTNTNIMDLEARKYNFIQELFTVERESVVDTLERVLKREKEEYQEISTENKKELDNRLENYKNNPNDVLDWKDVKENW